MNKKNNIRRKYSKMATLLTVMVLIGVILVNAIVFIVVDRFNLKLDMTSDKLFEISDITKTLVAELEDPISITVLNNERDFVGEIKEVVTRFDRLSDKITITYVDPYENPTFLDRYQKMGVSLEVNGVLVESGSRRKVFGLMDMYTFNSDMTAVNSFNAEQQITSAIMYVTSDNVPKVAFTQGHNEDKGTALPSLFEKNNFTTSDVTLSVEGVPEDIDILVICAPTRDFTYDEIAAIDDFMLKRGGRLMAFMQPGSEPLPILEEFLAEWGIGVRSDLLVVEPKDYIASNPLYLMAKYAQHPINAYFSNNQYYTMMPASCALQQLFTYENGIMVSPVLMASKDSYAKNALTSTDLTLQAGDETGPFVLAVTSSMNINIGSDKKEAKIFVAGSRAMYADDVLALPSIGNADFLAQVISWCSDGMEIINVPTRTMTLPPLSILTYQAFLLGGLFVIVIPLALLLMGIGVWFKRRHL